MGGADVVNVKTLLKFFIAFGVAGGAYYYMFTNGLLWYYVAFVLGLFAYAIISEEKELGNPLWVFALIFFFVTLVLFVERVISELWKDYKRNKKIRDFKKRICSALRTNDYENTLRKIVREKLNIKNSDINRIFIEEVHDKNTWKPVLVIELTNHAHVNLKYGKESERFKKAGFEDWRDWLENELSKELNIPKEQVWCVYKDIEDYDDDW